MPEGKLGKDLEAVLFLESLSSAYATFHDLQIMKPSLEPSKLYKDVIDYAGSSKSIDGERQQNDVGIVGTEVGPACIFGNRCIQYWSGECQRPHPPVCHLDPNYKWDD